MVLNFKGSQRSFALITQSYSFFPQAIQTTNLNRYYCFHVCLYFQYLWLKQKSPLVYEVILCFEINYVVIDFYFINNLEEHFGWDVYRFPSTAFHIHFLSFLNSQYLVFTALILIFCQIWLHENSSKFLDATQTFIKMLLYLLT